MTNIFSTLINFYNKTAFTHNYIFGFEYKGGIYAVKAKSDILENILSLDKTSSKRGGFHTLRFTPNKEIKAYLLTLSADYICSVNYFNELVNNSIYNRGEIFEKLITEKNNQIWKKDNVPYTMDGDITINSIAYQIKFQKATFITEKQYIKAVV